MIPRPNDNIVRRWVREDSTKTTASLSCSLVYIWTQSFRQWNDWEKLTIEIFSFETTLSSKRITYSKNLSFCYFKRSPRDLSHKKKFTFTSNTQLHILNEMHMSVCERLWVNVFMWWTVLWTKWEEQQKSI